jgi:hypothetical protein
MITALLLALVDQAIICLLDFGIWLKLGRRLATEDMKNSDLRKWELTGL